MDAKEEFKKLVERMWQDVATQPWTDPGYVGEARDMARTHFVNATTDDLVALHEQLKEAEK